MKKSLCSLVAVVVIVGSGLFVSFLWVSSTEINAKYAAKVAREVLSLSGAVDAKELKGGFSGTRLFVVTSNSKKYVIRFSDEESERFFEDINNASVGGYGPHIYFVDSERHIVIMEYLPSKYSSYVEHLKELLEPSSSKKLYINLGNFLRKIRQSPIIYKSTNIFEQMRKTANKIKCKAKSDIPLAKIKNVAGFIYEAVLPYMGLAPCHNDLHPSNLMFLKNEVKAVDYEDFAMGDPYFDVAWISMFYCIDAAYDQILLSTYLGRKPSSVEKAKLYLVKQAALLGFALKALVVTLGGVHRYTALQTPSFSDCIKNWSEGKIDPFSPARPDDRIIIAKVFIEKAFANIDSQEFKEATEILREESWRSSQAGSL